MDFASMRRDPEAVFAALRVVEDGNSALTVAKEPCRIYIPARYVECNLADLGEAIRSMAIFPIVVGDAYAVMSVIAFVWLTPSSYRLTEVGEDNYYELSFDKGATVITNMDVIKDDINTYFDLDEFYFKGNVPEFMNLKDVAKLFTTALKYAGMNLAPNNIPLELVVSAIARQAKDRTLYHRHSADPAGKGDKPGNIAWIGLRNVILGAQGTIAKITGSRIADGITSALRSPSTKVETLEKLLRM